MEEWTRKLRDLTVDSYVPDSEQLIGTRGDYEVILRPRSRDAARQRRNDRREQSVPYKTSRPTESNTSEARLASSLISHATPDDQQLGQEFSVWFYKLLNAENPSILKADRDNPGAFGPQHFWESCFVAISGPAPYFKSKSISGSTKVSDCLKDLVRRSDFMFSPNVSKEGVRTMQSPYGPLMVKVCGTIHHSDDCFGIFEQTFGLVCDPSTPKTWKIKIADLLVIKRDVETMPKILSPDVEMLSLAKKSMKIQIF